MSQYFGNARLKSAEHSRLITLLAERAVYSGAAVSAVTCLQLYSHCQDSGARTLEQGTLRQAKFLKCRSVTTEPSGKHFIILAQTVAL
jgi:hypothetical protein